MTEEEIIAEFETLGIDFQKVEHSAVFTVEESGSVHLALDAAHTKNLFLKDKRDEFWLIVLPSERRADLKAIAAQLGAGKYSFGKPDELEQILRLKAGSVTPIAAVNAPLGEVKVVFDATFRGHRRIAIHPLRNTATIALDFERLVSWLSQKGVVVQIAALA